MFSYNDTAIILRRYPFGEADYLLTLFTKNRGKVKVVAKGVRKVTSRRGGHLDLFNQVKIQVREGKGLGILTEAKATNTLVHAKKSIKKIAHFYFLGELMENLFVDEEKNYVVFQKLVNVFDGIEKLNLDQEPEMEKVAREFEVFVLKNLGYWSDEVQGKFYPQRLRAQREFNHNLIRDISQRQINSTKFLDSV